jgi:DNA-binding beta-propeller fold protein YncE
MTKRRTYHLTLHEAAYCLAGGLALVLLGAMPVAQAPPPKQDLLKVPAQTTWPLPPDEPRVKYLANWATSEDVGATKKTTAFSWKEKLLGRDKVAAEREPIRSFLKPFGVALDGFGRVIVTDPARPAVVVIDPARKMFEAIGDAQRQVHFRVPIGVAVDAANNIYIGDNGLKQILVFGPDLAFRFSLRVGLEAPWVLAVDHERNRLYAVDTRRHALIVYDPASGKLLGQLAKRGEGPGEFNFPTGVAVAPDGSVYVTDSMNSRVEVFTPQLKFVRAFGTLGDSPGQFRRPKGIAVDADGVVYVVDADYCNFQMFTPDGKALMFVGGPGPRPGQMILPAGVAVDRASRRIYVCEQQNKRVQIFERVGPPLTR